MSDLTLNCPHCGRVNENHDGPTPASDPGPGDVSICWGCRRIGLYDEFAGRLIVRVPSSEEQRELDADPNVRRVLGAVTESYTPDEANSLIWGDAR